MSPASVKFGRYEAFQRIAAGGMATVYAGRALGPAGFQRLVAIKVMHEHIADDPEFSAMFLDEARLAAAIRHPNVVPMLDVSEDGRFLVMELVEGASLRDVIRSKRHAGEVLSFPCVLRIVLDALEGLQAAHELKGPDGQPLHLVHRDVSPHNVLVGKDGITRITDFGIAYAEERLTVTRSGTLKGKMPYMAPEQIEGQPCDRRVDVYAMGCVLWETLTGLRLFKAPNEAALARRILMGEYEGPRSVRSEVPPSIDAVCMRALGSLDERYESAAAFAEALEAASEEAGIRVARPRAVAALTDGIRLEIELHGEEGPPTVHTPRLEEEPNVRADLPGQDTLPEDEDDDPRAGLPAAARPVAVGAASVPEPTGTPLRGGPAIPAGAGGTLPLEDEPAGQVAATLPEAGHEPDSAPADSAEAQILAVREAAKRGELVAPGVAAEAESIEAGTAGEPPAAIAEEPVSPAGVPRRHPARAVAIAAVAIAWVASGLWTLFTPERPPESAPSTRPVEAPAPALSETAREPLPAPSEVTASASAPPAKSVAPLPPPRWTTPAGKPLPPSPLPPSPLPPSPPPAAPPPPPPTGGEFVPDKL